MLCKLGCKTSTFWQPIGKLKEKIHQKLCILQKRDLYLNQFSNKKGAIGKPERPKKHPIWAAHPRTHLSTKYPPPPQGSSQAQHDIWAPGGTQIWLGQGCAARASKPLPIFKGDFGRKGYPFLRIFLEKYPGGGTHIFGRMGMCCSNGSFFYKKSLNMGPIFYQKILKHGTTFLTEPKFSGFCMAKTPKIVKFLKNGPIFQEKSLKMGTLFCQNHP